MNEADYLRHLQEEPENQSVRCEYYEWLARNHPSRSDFVRLMKERTKIQHDLAVLEGALEAHPIRADQP
jgi:hypothetical protein